MDCLGRIKELLKIRGWSVYQLSQRSGIPQSTLSNLFLRNNAPTIPTLEKICEGLGITVAEFFGDQTELSNADAELLREWRILPEKTKAIIFDLIKEYNNR